MEKLEIEGDVFAALSQLIFDITQIKNNASTKSLSEVLYKWDKTRGNDWFTSSKRQKQDYELLELKRLKMKYE